MGFWFSRSAWSLRTVAAWRWQLKPDARVCVWLPDFFCDQSLGGLREAGATLVFYPITAGLVPDWTACGELAQAQPPDVFVLVHYFGVAGPAKIAAEFSRRHGAVFVEDCAHCLLPGADVGQTGDFALFSPHKLLALPDGAVLVALPAAARFVGGSTARLRESLQSIIAAFPAGKSSAAGWVVRRLLARSFPQAFARWWRGSAMLDPVSGTGSAGLPWAVSPTALSFRLLARYLPHLEADAGLRLQHSAQLKAGLLAIGGAQFLAPTAGTGVPFMLGVRLVAKAELLALRGCLQVAGLPVTCWPDLPPEVLARPEHHGPALQLWRTTVFLPVHQSLPVDRWLSLAGCPRLPRKDEPDVEFDWSPVLAEWAECYRRAPRSSLLQSRFYVRAKQSAGKWRARFALVKIAGRPVATLTALQLGGLTRINRGPCWLEAGIEPGTQRAVLGALGRRIHWWRGQLLLIAPNVPLHDEVLADLSAVGARRRRMGSWHSAWIDLRRPEAELLAALNGKWRNQMNSARRAGLAVRISRAEEAVKWIVSRHEEVKLERGIDGPAGALLLALQQEATDPDEELVVLCVGELGAETAGVLLARHGTSATYLVGWSSEEGRRQNAGNLLLWEAIRELRRTGAQWLDLCGIDERRTRGIAAFKRGLGGEEYQLAGEYWMG